MNNLMKLDTVNIQIAKLMDKYAFCKDSEQSKKLKEKIDTLEKIKREIYLENNAVVRTIIAKNKDGKINE